MMNRKMYLVLIACLLYATVVSSVPVPLDSGPMVISPPEVDVPESKAANSDIPADDASQVEDGIGRVLEEYRQKHNLDDTGKPKDSGSTGTDRDYHLISDATDRWLRDYREEHNLDEEGTSMDSSGRIFYGGDTVQDVYEGDDGNLYFDYQHTQEVPDDLARTYDPYSGTASVGDDTVQPSGQIFYGGNTVQDVYEGDDGNLYFDPDHTQEVPEHLADTYQENTGATIQSSDEGGDSSSGDGGGDSSSGDGGDDNGDGDSDEDGDEDGEGEDNDAEGDGGDDADSSGEGGWLSGIGGFLSKIQWNEFIYEFSEGAQFGADVSSIFGYDNSDWADSWTAFFMENTFGAWLGGFWEEEICRVDSYADDVQGSVVVETDSILKYGMHVEGVRSQPGVYYDEDNDEYGIEYFYKVTFVFINNLSTNNYYNIQFQDTDGNWVDYWVNAWPEVQSATTVNGGGDNAIVDYSSNKYEKVRLVIDKPIIDHQGNEVSEVMNAIDSPEYEDIQPPSPDNPGSSGGSGGSGGSGDSGDSGDGAEPARNPDF